MQSRQNDYCGQETAMFKIHTNSPFTDELVLAQHKLCVYGDLLASMGELQLCRAP